MVVSKHPIDERHLTGLLLTAGKAMASMPEGRRVVEQLKKATSRDDLLFLLRSADLSLADPARNVVMGAASKDWENVRSTLLRSAEVTLHDLYSANA